MDPVVEASAYIAHRWPRPLDSKVTDATMSWQGAAHVQLDHQRPLQPLDIGLTAYQPLFCEQFMETHSGIAMECAFRSKTPRTRPSSPLPRKLVRPRPQSATTKRAQEQVPDQNVDSGAMIYRSPHFKQRALQQLEAETYRLLDKTSKIAWNECSCGPAICAVRSKNHSETTRRTASRHGVDQACRRIYKFVCRQYLRRKRNRVLMELQEKHPELLEDATLRPVSAAVPRRQSQAMKCTQLDVNPPPCKPRNKTRLKSKPRQKHPRPIDKPASAETKTTQQSQRAHSGMKSSVSINDPLARVKREVARTKATSDLKLSLNQRQTEAERGEAYIRGESAMMAIDSYLRKKQRDHKRRRVVVAVRKITPVKYMTTETLTHVVLVLQRPSCVIYELRQSLATGPLAETIEVGGVSFRLSSAHRSSRALLAKFSDRDRVTSMNDPIEESSHKQSPRLGPIIGSKAVANSSSCAAIASSTPVFHRLVPIPPFNTPTSKQLSLDSPQVAREAVAPSTEEEAELLASVECQFVAATRIQQCYSRFREHKFSQGVANDLSLLDRDKFHEKPLNIPSTPSSLDGLSHAGSSPATPTRHESPKASDDHSEVEILEFIHRLFNTAKIIQRAFRRFRGILHQKNLNFAASRIQRQYRVYVNRCEIQMGLRTFLAKHRRVERLRGQKQKPRILPWRVAAYVAVASCRFRRRVHEHRLVIDQSGAVTRIQRQYRVHRWRRAFQASLRQLLLQKQEEGSVAGVLPASESEAWQPFVDEASGMTYYYNSITGESKWSLEETQPELSVSPIEVMDDEEYVIEGLDLPQLSVVGDEPAPLQPLPPLPNDPEEWSQVVDEGGYIYYLHSRTNETSWQPPESWRVTSTDESEWQTFTTPQGSLFYYNTSTGETSWHCPV
ncbi:unnamed protein product [Aphanomyces euteiches]